MKEFLLKIRVSAKKMTLVWDLLAGEDGIHLDDVQEISTKPRRASPGSHEKHFNKDANGVPITGKMLVRDLLKSGPKTVKEIEAGLTKAGHRGSNASSRLADMKASGEVRRLNDGRYALTV